MKLQADRQRAADAQIPADIQKQWDQIVKVKTAQPSKKGVSFDPIFALIEIKITD